MVVAENTYLGAKNAEETRRGGVVEKQRFGLDQKEQLDPQKLLEWELEQEKWAKKTNANSIDDAQWLRVGIKFRSGQSGYSSSEDDRLSERQSPVMTGKSQISLEAPLGTFSSTAQPVPEVASDNFLLEDQRKIMFESTRAYSVSSPTAVRPTSSIMNTLSDQGRSPVYVPSAPMQRNFPNSLAYHQTGSYGYVMASQPAHQALSRAASWNSYGAASRKDEADELEAEFQRLGEGSRGGSFCQGIEGRDEYNGAEVIHLEASPSDDIIHLEDQASLEEEEIKVEPTGKKGFGVADLEAEFNDAVRRKEALFRNCSIDSNETDDILHDYVEHKIMEDNRQHGAIPKQKSRLQVRLDRFERGNLDLEQNTDVSQYPRLQQIRQRRRERLKALQHIRQERAEIWDTLEANWEQMENSMTTRAVANEYVNKTTETNEGPFKTDPNDDDSLKLSASELSSKGDERSGDLTGAAAIAKEPTSDLVELLASMNEKNGITKTPPSSVPESTVSLLENITADAKTVEGAIDNDKTDKKEDPPSFGAFLTQSMSDVGSKVVNILKSVRSVEEQQPEESVQVTETCEEETNMFAAPTEEGREDDESSALEMDLAVLEEEDPAAEAQGCVNPLQDFLDKKRRLVTEVGLGHGCLNPFVQFGMEKAQLMCPPKQHAPNTHETQAQLPVYNNPIMVGNRDSFDPVLGNRGSFDPMVGNRDSFDPMQSYHGSIDQMQSTAYSDTNDYVEIENNWSEDDQKSINLVEFADSRSDGRQSTSSDNNFKRSKKSKKKKKGKEGASDLFFTLVDNLLVNNILNIVDEKVVNDMAHNFGFD